MQNQEAWKYHLAGAERQLFFFFFFFGGGGGILCGHLKPKRARLRLTDIVTGQKVSTSDHSYSDLARCGCIVMCESTSARALACACVLQLLLKRCIKGKYCKLITTSCTQISSHRDGCLQKRILWNRQVKAVALLILLFVVGPR